MLCGKCGFTIKHDQAPLDAACMACGSSLKWDADDFLLHGAGGLVTNSREGQVKMARAVEAAIAKKNCLLVEGPVGVGKSFAYLLPALLSGKRTVVSTAQKPLQQQLAANDGPRLVAAISEMFPKATVAMLKGKSNYACRLHVEHTADVPEFAAWLGTSETADLSEYEGRRPAKMWDVTAEGCLGTRCPQAKDCGYRQSRKRALEASVIVVNHALVAFDLRFGPMKLFGPYDNLIVDEAHKAPSAFRGAFEESISDRGVARVVRKMDDLRHVTLPVLSGAVLLCWNDAFKHAKNLEGAIQPDPFGAAGTVLLDQLEELRAFVDSEAGVLNRAHVENGIDTAFHSEVGLELADLGAMLGLSRALHKTVAALKLLKKPTQNTLLTAEKQAGVHRFKATPISVGAMVGDKLSQVPSLVFTSATMTNSGSFADFSRDLGLHRLKAPAVVTTVATKAAPAMTFRPAAKEIVELEVMSPFDYRAQGAFLYIPRHIATAASDGGGDDIQRGKYLDSISREILALVRASGGNALVLFTATSDLREVEKRLLADDPTIPWLSDTGQGAEAVLRTFKDTPGGVILGLKSFWEGVSIEGDKLWLVIITKLPFPSPTDPLMAAQARQMEKELTAQGVPLKEQGYATFRRLSMPPMITDIRQGAGRLVRTTTDRGVLAILDTRVWSGKTGVGAADDQKAPRGYGVTVVNALGYNNNWTPDFSYVQAKFRQWRKPKGTK